MTGQLLIAFTALLLEDQHFLGPAAVVEDSSLHNSTFHIRGTYLHIPVSVHEQHLVELDRSALLRSETVHENFLASLYLKLLACNIHDCVHKYKNFNSPDRKRLHKQLFVNGLPAIISFWSAKITLFDEMTKKNGIFVNSNLDRSKTTLTMDTPFIYDRFVTGKNFIGRKSECTALRNLLDNKEHICIYEPPMAGKMSVIQQTLFNMRISGKQYTVAESDLFNVRSSSQFLLKLGSSLIRSQTSTPAEYEALVGTMLEGTHFRFDQERFSLRDEVLTLEGAPDENDIRKLLSLPYRLAERDGNIFFVVIGEFQSLLALEETEYEMIFRIMSEIFSGADKAAPWQVSFVLTGSKVNAMKHIFEEKKYFYRQVEHLPLNEIDHKEILDHIVRGFLTGGKVIENDLVLGAIKLFRGNIWYINHFCSICDSLSKGYMNEGILMDALGILISVHRHRFMSIADDLTTHQMSLIRAILDGETRFSSAEVIEKYGLNSSANVRRVKDALKKKEIITFNEKDDPEIIDPLFRYWIEKYYFER